MFEDENLVLEDTENTEEQTAEETGAELEDTDDVESTEEVDTETAKTYTQEEVDAMIEAKTNERIDTILPKRIARSEAKIRKQVEKEYEGYVRLGKVVTTGSEFKDVDEATNQLTNFYKSKGKNIPSFDSPKYSESDIKALANSDADEIIADGFGEVVSEVDRLARLGADKMSQREKLTFVRLSEYRKQEEGRRELAKMGVNETVITSKEFKDFASNFNPNTPMKSIYELYTKTTSDAKPDPKKIGSMKNDTVNAEKEFYTAEEANKLTSKQMDNPKIFARVMESMKKW